MFTQRPEPTRSLSPAGTADLYCEGTLYSPEYVAELHFTKATVFTSSGISSVTLIVCYGRLASSSLSLLDLLIAEQRQARRKDRYNAATSYREEIERWWKRLHSALSTREGRP